jgi:hypothetical protein
LQIVLAVVACARAAVVPAYAGLPLGYAGVLPYAGALPYNAPIVPPSSQFSAQDEFGNINYGYANINSAKHEVGNTYGGVTGSYRYEAG